MKNKSLVIQKNIYKVYVLLVIAFFVATLIISTPYYETYLYGNAELVDYFTSELQVYNKTAFSYAIIMLIGLVCSLLCSPNKYFPNYFTGPILFCSSVITGILASINLMLLKPVLNYYETYDFSGLKDLADYIPNSFFSGFMITVCILLIIIVFAQLIVYIFNFTKYLRKRGSEYV